jgi:hypothetical protein
MQIIGVPGSLALVLHRGQTSSLDVQPTQSDQLSTAQTGAGGKEHHHPLTRLKFCAQHPDTFRRQNLRVFETLGRCADCGDGIAGIPSLRTEADGNAWLYAQPYSQLCKTYKH